MTTRRSLVALAWLWALVAALGALQGTSSRSDTPPPNVHDAKQTAARTIDDVDGVEHRPGAAEGGLLLAERVTTTARNSRALPRVRTARSAPRTAGARFVAGSDGVVTDLVGAAPNAVSIGHYPAYVNAGARTGARTFSMSDESWNAMSPTEQWVRNQRFLDRTIRQGSEIRLATPVDLARSRSFFERELQYLFKHGYAPNADGTMLVRGGL